MISSFVVREHFSRGEFASEIVDRLYYLCVTEAVILGWLSVGSSGGSAKSAQEQSNRDEITRKIAAEKVKMPLLL